MRKPWMTLVALLAAFTFVRRRLRRRRRLTGRRRHHPDHRGSRRRRMGDSADAAEPVGEACGEIPTDGEGSSAGMADDPTATAASNNPLLSTLVAAVGAADLGDTLNDTSASYTVFAPYNGAFDKLDPATVEGPDDGPGAEGRADRHPHVPRVRR